MLSNCPACYLPLDGAETCEHKKRYQDAFDYVEGQGIPIRYAPNGASHDAWKAGRVLYSPPSPPCIDLWPTAFEIYGWDMVTSVLIHEFGHCKLYEIERALPVDVETERKANDYGRRYMPPDLVPLHYEDYRAFFLQSYLTPERMGSKEQCLEELRVWQSKRV